MSIRSSSHQESDELTGSDENQGEQHEDSEAMADDGQGSSEAQMLHEDGADLGFPTEDRSKIFKSDHLQAAD